MKFLMKKKPVEKAIITKKIMENAGEDTIALLKAQDGFIIYNIKII